MMPDLVFRVCPFCNRKQYSHPNTNTLCPCGAKYYVFENWWLNRKTGERRINNEHDSGI